MQIVQESRGCETSNNFTTTKQFSIKHSPKMFKMLSDGVYKDKLAAFIREIANNCADEHRMSGTKRPFEITLPTQLSATMEFKDFGRGLSEEGVFNLYTTYGASTKDAINDINGEEIVGGFGIGSKSPFAYTDSFIVESRHEGVFRAYVAMLDDQRMPTIVQTTPKEGVQTDEENGLTVKVAVQQHDIRNCSDKLRNILEFFTEQPIIHGITDGWAVNSRKYLVENDKVGFKMSDQNDYRSNARIILGGNAFPIEFSQLEGKSQYTYRGLDIWMPMGSVDVAISRESLSYDPLTIKNILTKLDEIEEAIQADAIKKVTAIKNRYLRSIAYSNLAKGGGGLLSNTKAFQERCDCDDYFTEQMQYKELDTVYSSSKLILRKKDLFSMSFHYDNVFIIVDDPVCCDIKTKQFVEDNDINIKTTGVYQIPNHSWPKLYERLGKPPKSYIHYTSKLTYVKKTSGKAGVKGISCYTLGRGHGYKSPLDVQHLPDDKHYLLMDNSYVYINDKAYTHDTAACLIPKDVYLIFRTNRGKVVEYGWTEGSSLVTKHCKDFVVKYSEKNMPYELYDLVKIDTELEQINLLIKEDGFKVSSYNRELVKWTKQLIKYVENTKKTHNIPNHIDFYERRRHTSGSEHSFYETALDLLAKQGEEIDVRSTYNKIKKKLKRLEKDTLLTQWYASFPLIEGCDNNVTTTNKVDYISKWG